MSSMVQSAAGAAGAGVGGGIAVFAVLKFVRWLVEFIYARLDVGHARISSRLAHVEQELDAWREFGMVMMHALARIDPDNPALAHAAQLLRKTAPIATMDLDELMERLDGIEGSASSGSPSSPTKEQQ